MDAKNLEKTTCTECNLTIKLPVVAEREKALCPRCGYLLTVNHPFALERILAFATSALMFLILALSFDFVAINYQGQTYSIALLDTYFLLTEQHYFIIALVVMLTVIVLPVLVISALFYLIFNIKAEHYPLKGELVAKCLFALLPWSMAEIFLIGVLVSLIKISTMTQVHINLSFYAYVFFAISYIAAISFVDKRQLHLKLQALAALQAEQHTNHKNNSSQSPSNVGKVNTSIQQTWALIFTAFLLYFPANFLPIMTTRSLGKDEFNTILGGVIVLWRDGSYPVAIIIFIASIVVPIIKFIVLAWLNYSVQQGDNSYQLQRAQLYRITEFIGRWSMIDIFAVAILASLIQLGTAMVIHPGPAAVSFCAVVILTMLAANTFDSTLIWKKTPSYER